MKGIATLLSVLFCICPGLFSLLFGGLFTLAAFDPGAEIDVFGSSDPQAALTFGSSVLCGGFVAAVILWQMWGRNEGRTSG